MRTSAFRRRAVNVDTSESGWLWPPGAEARPGVTRAVSAMMPPSPLLSARITKRRYLTEMTMIRLQKMSESTPRMFSGVGATP